MNSQIYDKKIPQGWEVKKISDFTDCTAGGTPNTQIPAYWGGKIPWMSSGELHNKQIYDVAERITQAGLENSSTKFIPKNSVLIGLAGQGKTRGTVAISKISLCTNQSIAAIFPNNNFCPEFLLYNLENRYDELRSLSAGDGGRGGLNLHIIKNIEILFPPKVEQERIAQVLGDMDELISAKCELLGKKRAIKQAAAQQLLTPKPHWHTATLGKIAKFRRGSFPQPYGLAKWYGGSGAYPFVQVADVANKNFKLNEITNQTISKIAQQFSVFVPSGTVLVTLQGSIGRVAITQYDSYVDRTLAIFENYLLDIDKIFFAYKLHEKFAIESQKAPGGIIKTITKDEFTKFEISYPNFTEQTKIAQILSDMDDEISALQDEIEKLKMIKQGAMDELLSGKIRLKG
jgi:predicted type I restriction-modification enzyme, S subunit